MPNEDFIIGDGYDIDVSLMNVFGFYQLVMSVIPGRYLETNLSVKNRRTSTCLSDLMTRTQNQEDDEEENVDDI